MIAVEWTTDIIEIVCVIVALWFTVGILVLGIIDEFTYWKK